MTASTKQPQMADMATADRPRRAQFLTDVLLTAVGGGMDYWATIRLYHPTTPPTAILSADDESDQLLTVTIDTIEAGITTLTTGVNANRSFTMSGEEYWAQFLTANQTNGAAGDYDADIADNIVQAGLFGNIVYG